MIEIIEHIIGLLFVVGLGLILVAILVLAWLSRNIEPEQDEHADVDRFSR